MRRRAAAVFLLAALGLSAGACEYFYQTRLELRPRELGAVRLETAAEPPAEVREFIDTVDALALAHGLSRQNDVWPPVYWDELENIHLELAVAGDTVRAVIWQIKETRRGSSRRYKELRVVLIRELRQRYGERVEVLRQW